tara:strand:+ start:2359 stop:3018 length:660 start_codon:yes stop_codon:yes gene_type:complete
MIQLKHGGDLMLKLKELLKLDGMVYGSEIKPKHKKRMERELVYIHNPIIPHNPPPINSSRETLKELHWLRDYNNGLVNEIMVKEGDDVKGSFREFLESKDLKYPKKYVGELIKDSGRIIYELKYKYNRPRPTQVAEFLQVEGFDTTTLDSMHTPSYPSGHSTQGIFVARALGKMFKEHSEELYEIGKMISESRLMARAHFPSDSKFGEQVGEILYQNLK